MTMTVTLIVGFIIIVGLFITKFNSFVALPDQIFPDQIMLPNGTRAATFTASKDWFAIITTDDELLLYDQHTNDLIRRINLLQETP